MRKPKNPILSLFCFPQFQCNREKRSWPIHNYLHWGNPTTQFYFFFFPTNSQQPNREQRRRAIHNYLYRGNPKTQIDFYFCSNNYPATKQRKKEQSNIQQSKLRKPKIPIEFLLLLLPQFPSYKPEENNKRAIYNKLNRENPKSQFNFFIFSHNFPATKQRKKYQSNKHQPKSRKPKTQFHIFFFSHNFPSYQTEENNTKQTKLLPTKTETKKRRWNYRHCHSQPWAHERRDEYTCERKGGEQSNAGTNQRNHLLGCSERPSTEHRHSCRCCSSTCLCTCFCFCFCFLGIGIGFGFGDNTVGGGGGGDEEKEKEKEKEGGCVCGAWTGWDNLGGDVVVPSRVCGVWFFFVFLEGSSFKGWVWFALAFWYWICLKKILTVEKADMKLMCLKAKLEWVFWFLFFCLISIHVYWLYSLIFCFII